MSNIVKLTEHQLDKVENIYNVRLPATINHCVGKLSSEDKKARSWLRGRRG